MKCVICRHGETAPGTTTMTLEPDEQTVVVIRHVPAEVCDNCGEAYTDEDTTRRVMAIAQEASANGVQVDIRVYRAV